jgi:hypothetical protein
MSTRQERLARATEIYGRMFLAEEFRAQAQHYKKSSRPALPCLATDKWSDVVALGNQIGAGRIVCYDLDLDAIAVVEGKLNDDAPIDDIHPDVTAAMAIDSFAAIDALGRSNVLMVSASDLAIV